MNSSLRRVLRDDCAEREHEVKQSAENGKQNSGCPLEFNNSVTSLGSLIGTTTIG